MNDDIKMRLLSGDDDPPVYIPMENDDLRWFECYVQRKTHDQEQRWRIIAVVLAVVAGCLTAALLN